jgi:hypothetical protein
MLISLVKGGYYHIVVNWVVPGRRIVDNKEILVRGKING